jgi:cbb3-type cytochrome oxidase maturation protein
MEVILILITFSLMLALAFLGAFLWAVKTDQYEDTYTPALRILVDDEKIGSENNNIYKES